MTEAGKGVTGGRREFAPAAMRGDDAGVSISLPTNVGLVTYPAGATFGPRRMGDYELVWVVSGEVVYERDGVARACPGESMVMCVPGHEDFFRWDPKRPTRHAFFHFDVKGELPGLPAVRDWPVVRGCEAGDVVRPMFRHLLRWYTLGVTPGPGDRELLTATVRAMVYAFVLGREGTAAVETGALPQAIERTMGWIRKQLETDATEAIELGQLAKAGGVSPEHLCRLFRKHTGRSPAETVRLARLDRAAGLLARSNYTVGEVAGLCGFASQFHFSRAFKAAYGESPTGLRERVRNGETPPVPRLLRGGGNG